GVHRAGGGQSDRRVPRSVVRLPDDADRGSAIDDENFELLVEGLVDRGERRTLRRKPRRCEADRRSPRAVVLLPDDIEDTVLVHHEHFELPEGGIVGGGHVRALCRETRARQRERSLPDAIVLLPDNVERAVRTDDEDLELLVDRLVYGGQWRARRREARNCQ